MAAEGSGAHTPKGAHPPDEVLTPAPGDAPPPADPPPPAADPLPPAPPVTKHEPAVDVAVRQRQRQNPVRWSAVWSGLVVALATYILVELIFFSFGWLTFAQANPGTTALLVSWLIGIFAFLLGGTIAGGTSIWGGAREGVVHGVVLWGLAVVAILFLTLFGGGALFTSVGTIITGAAGLGQASNLPSAQLQQIADNLRVEAGWAAIALAVWLVAACLGSLLGAKMGSSKDGGAETTVHTH